jgi:hypothetical protein
MKFKDLYDNKLDRKVNPAVSASDLSENTVHTEIEEYVFTQEIIANLYNILVNIKVNQGSHVGIWINGYYGSGKSHFLKYASYCLSNIYSDRAFARLIEATQEILLGDKDTSVLEQANVSLSELQSLQNWYVNKADVEMIMFNIGDVHDANADSVNTFTTIFWNQFNSRRGYNSFNLPMAQYLEKALDDDGKFEEFKEYVKSKGYDWERNISRFAAGRLDLALRMAKEVDPALAIDVIRERILKNDVNVSVEAFAAEMKEYIDLKNNRNFRIMFFVDEVSQFIGEHSDLLLQLQSLVKRLDEVCESQVWISCTAQQTLEDVVKNVGGSDTNPEDEVGKILGRFEVRASLQGTSPEYITQKRILDKKGEVEILLEELFEKKKAMLDAQFILPSTYQSYKNKEDFADFYPFVPYQFQLIMRVLDSFVNMNYVDKQVKGNERSLLNITFSIAQKTAECEVGEFIPFDRFFGAMFQGSMQHLGQRAMANAREALKLIKKDETQSFYRRVVNVLFMVCNLSDVDKQGFSATIDNIVTLLMTKMDANKADIKEKVSQVLSFMIDKAVIRRIKTDNGIEIYEFYTEEESQVAQIIKNQKVDSNTYTEELYKIIYEHFGFTPSTNKETYATRSFNVGGNVDGKNILSNNPDVVVDFLTTASTDSPDQFAFNNQPNHLVFFMYPLFKDNQELHQNFIDYCRVQCFAQEPAISEERQRTKRIFQDRAKDMYQKDIKPKFRDLLDNCPVVSGQDILPQSILGSAKNKERYKVAITYHLQNLYRSAGLVNEMEYPKIQSDLVSKILRPIEPTLLDMPLSDAEKKVKDFLDRSPHDVTVADIVRQFAKVPYGWADCCSIYVVNELVRRHLYAYNYNNNPNVNREDVARNIVRDSNRFTIEPAKAISQDILNAFIEAWKHIFNIVSIKGSNDSTELYRSCKETQDSALNRLLINYRDLFKKVNGCPFASVIEESITMMEKWTTIRDPKEFFVTITDAKESAAALFDKCKSIKLFVDDQFDIFKKIKAFLDVNRDNFAFLPEDQKDVLVRLKEMNADMEPWERMPSYKKMMTNLNGRLNDCKSSLIETIKTNYNKAFDELEEYAAGVKVGREKFAARDTTILQKTNSNNFYALQANANVASFYEEQMKRINEAVPKPTAPKPYSHTPEGNDVVKEPPVATRTRRIVHLNTHTTHPIHSEEDIDLYLQRLKEELMQYIGGSNDIIVS